MSDDQVQRPERCEACDEPTSLCRCGQKPTIYRDGFPIDCTSAGEDIWGELPKYRPSEWDELQSELAAAKAEIANGNTLLADAKAEIERLTKVLRVQDNGTLKEQLTQANARIKELEKDIYIRDLDSQRDGQRRADYWKEFDGERAKAKEREQKLVVALTYALGKFNAAIDDPQSWLSKCANGAQYLREALKAHTESSSS